MDKTNTGLSSGQLSELRQRFGDNSIPEKKENVWRLWLKQFWGPLPWILEIAAILTFYSKDTLEGSIILGLLLANGLISISQRSRADKALAELRQTLQINARVFRDQKWQELPASELLPGDLVRLRIGDIVTADMHLLEGSVSVDQSSITGESLPIELTANGKLFSGSTLVRGEATAVVDAIGTSTKYGASAQLLETSHPPTHMEKIIFTIIKYQFAFNVFLILAIVITSLVLHWPTTNIIPLIIVLLITSVPIAFPTMFTIAQTFGALQMARINHRRGVLVRRLASVQDGAMMNVLCTDKTGTLTQNKLSIGKILSYDGYSQAEVVALAGACSNSADQDPIDKAILDYAAQHDIKPVDQEAFTPFDPLTKKTQATVRWKNQPWQVLKGLPEVIETSGQAPPTFKKDLLGLSQDGYRLVAVSLGQKNNYRVIGIIALADPIRDDSLELLRELESLGITIKMITGDNLETAQSVASQLKITGLACRTKDLRDNPSLVHSHSVFAEAYPEDKLLIISQLQKAGYTVAMTGDGVNDAPALRQAEVGIAVASATDIAKSSASFILTNPGLKDIVDAVKMSRQVYQRIRTWALNKVIKSFEIAIFTTGAYLLTKNLLLTPLLAVLILFSNDFVTISIATDKARAGLKPAVWHLGRLMMSAIILAVVLLLVLAGGVILAKNLLHLSLDQVATLSFLLLVFQGQASLYALRSWPHFWQLAPSRTLLTISIAVWPILIIGALLGIVITAIPVYSLWFVGFVPLISLLVVDLIKNYTFIEG